MFSHQKFQIYNGSDGLNVTIFYTISAVILTKGHRRLLSYFPLSMSISLPANYPSVPITDSAVVFAQPFIFITTAPPIN